jgi:rhodanese-related sulfurtransferase
VTTPTVDAQAGHTLVDDGALLLDCRQPDEWEAGHAPGAVFIPMREVPERVAELPRDRRIVAICRSGSRSGRVTEFLVGEGYDVVNLAGGMKAWAAEGYPVETDDGSPGVVA